jgi:hypothetical protein
MCIGAHPQGATLPYGLDTLQSFLRNSGTRLRSARSDIYATRTYLFRHINERLHAGEPVRNFAPALARSPHFVVPPPDLLTIM